MRYLVRCACCDRAFWQRERTEPLPAHTRWDRGLGTHAEGDHCAGSHQPGYWIGEGEGPLHEWPGQKA